MNTKVHLLKRPVKLKGKTCTYWTLRWSGRGGKHCYRSIGRTNKVTRSQAVQARDQMIVALGTGKARIDKPGTMTLGEFGEFAVRSFGHGLQPSTLVEWKLAARHASDTLGHDRKLEDITWSDAGEIRRNLNHLAPATVNKTLGTLKGMLAKATERKMILENPFMSLGLKSFSRAKRIFTDNEIKAMLSHADPRWAGLIRLAVTSGLRKSELLHLRWCDIDAGTVRVEEHHGDDGIIAWQPKTEKSTRTVPVPAESLKALVRSSVSPYVFIPVARSRYLRGQQKAGKLRPKYDAINNFTRLFNKILGRAGVTPRGCFHDLRKTFGTRAASNGVPMHELQAHMGHSSITTTAEFYTQVEESAAARLRSVFSSVG